MNVSTEELDTWAQRAYFQSHLALSAYSAIERGDTRVGLQQVWQVQNDLVRLVHALIKAGAEDPYERAAAAHDEQFAHAGIILENKETPLHLLSSDKAQLYARCIREAAVACKAMEEERGIGDGLAEVLSDYADIAEEECYGPKMLRELE